MLCVVSKGFQTETDTSISHGGGPVHAYMHTQTYTLYVQKNTSIHTLPPGGSIIASGAKPGASPRHGVHYSFEPCFNGPIRHRGDYLC